MLFATIFLFPLTFFKVGMVWYSIKAGLTPNMFLIVLKIFSEIYAINSGLFHFLFGYALHLDKIRIVFSLLHRYSFQQQRVFENIVQKQEIARKEQFLIFPQCFLLDQKIVSPFVHIFDVVSVFAAELEAPKIGM